MKVVSKFNLENHRWTQRDLTADEDLGVLDKEQTSWAGTSRPTTDASRHWSEIFSYKFKFDHLFDYIILGNMKKLKSFKDM